MLAPPHRVAMRELLEWCDEAALARWAQEAAQLPEWANAHERLQNEGRRAKVNHPSSARSVQISAAAHWPDGRASPEMSFAQVVSVSAAFPMRRLQMTVPHRATHEIL